MDKLYLATKFPSHSSSPDRRVIFTTSHEYNLFRLSHFEYYNLTGRPRPIFLAFTQPNLSLHVKHSPSKLYLPLGRHIGRYVPLFGERGRDRFLWFFFKIKKRKHGMWMLHHINQDGPSLNNSMFFLWRYTAAIRH